MLSVTLYYKDYFSVTHNLCSCFQSMCKHIHMYYQWLSWMAFCLPCQIMKVFYRACELSQWMALIRMCVINCLVLSCGLCLFLSLIKDQHCCLCPDGRYNPPLDAHPQLAHPSHLPTCQLLICICSTRDITIAVK